MKFVASLVVVVGVAEANFRSGSVSTYEKFRYGKFVTRMKAPDRKGTVSSFFTYWDGPNFDPNEWNELDMEIVPSVEENPYSMNIIYGDGHEKVESHDYANRFDPHDDWHVYEMEWTPHYVSWSVDGREMRHVQIDDPAVHHLDKAQSLRMNFWTPTFNSWGAGFDPVDMPWYVLYDYVEVFTYDEEHNEFKFHWRDDFDAFDSGKWHKAAGGFESNTSVFHPSNAYTSGGHLVLKMEPEITREQDQHLKQSLSEAFGMDLDHRKQSSPSRFSKFQRGGRRGNEFATDSDSGSEYEAEDERFDHHDMKYVDHHDDYYKGEHGGYYVDHHDKYSHEHKEDDWKVRHPHLSKAQHHREDEKAEYSQSRREQHHEERPYQRGHYETVDRHYTHHQAEPEEHYYDHQYEHLYHEPALHESHDYYHHRAAPAHQRRHKRRAHYYRSDSEASSQESESTDSEAELEEYHRHAPHYTSSHHKADRHEKKLSPHYPGHHPEDVHYPGHHPESHKTQQRHSERHHDTEFYQKHYEHADERQERQERQESERSERDDEEPRQVDDEKLAKQEAKRQKKLAKQKRKEQEARLAQMGSEPSYAAQKWGLAGAAPDSERSDDEKTRKPLEYRHVVPPHASHQQKKQQNPQETEKSEKSEKPERLPVKSERRFTVPSLSKKEEKPEATQGKLTPRQPEKAKFQEPKHTFQEPEQKKLTAKVPTLTTVPKKTQTEEQEKSDPSQMTYDEFRLWKHNQKVQKKQRKLDTKKPKFGQTEPVEDEPQFRTYGEYRRWKQSQKTQKTEQKQLRKQQKESYKFSQTKAKTAAESKTTQDFGDEYVKFQHSKLSPMTMDEKFQHPIKPTKIDKEQYKFQHPQAKEQKGGEDERTLKQRTKAVKTHIFDEDEQPATTQKQEKPSKKQKYHGERRHESEYHHEEADRRWRHDHKHDHLEDHHAYDLFDFDDPMSDSDYDDLDEQTGIYHDEDPLWHPSHHVKHQYTDEQYYHSRDRYFPEDSYHAAGQMQYGVVPTDTLIAHALGVKPKPTEPVKQPATAVPKTTSKPAPAPAKPAPAPAKTAPAPKPTPAPKPAPKQTHHSAPHDEKPLIVAKPPTKSTRHHPLKDLQRPIHGAGHTPHQSSSAPSHAAPHHSTLAPRHFEPRRFQIMPVKPVDAHKEVATLPYGVGKDVELTIDTHGHVTKESHDHGATGSHDAPKAASAAQRHHSKPVRKIDDHHPVAKVPVPHMTTDEPEYHQVSHEAIKAPVATAPHHEKRQKLSAKEIADLRVQHGIKYEKDHSVEHYIEKVTHPEYKITGWIGGEDHDYWHQHDAFAHEHAEEHYGDEHIEDVAHLHLHPNPKAVDHHHESAHHEPHHESHHESRHEREPHHDYHGEYMHHIEHHEVQPEGEHWHEVDRRHHASPEHHTYHEEPHYAAVHEDDHHQEAAHYDSHQKTHYHHEQQEPSHAYYAHDYRPRHDPVIATLPAYAPHHHDVKEVSHHESTDYHYTDLPKLAHHDEGVYAKHYSRHHEPVDSKDHYYGHEASSHKESEHRHHDYPIVSEHSKHAYSYADDHHGSDEEHLLPHGTRHDSEHKGYHPELDHRFDDQHDVEAQHFHEHAVLHAPDLADHHSYHPKDVHQRWEPITHDHGPVYHDQYTYEKHAPATHEQDHKESSTYYSHDMLKQHEQKHEKRPEFGMDFGKSKSSFYSDKSHEPTKTDTRDEREVEYIIDAQGHVRELVPLKK